MLSALQLLDNSLNGMSDLHTLAAPEEELSFPCGATTSRIRGGGGKWEGKEEKSIPPCSHHLAGYISSAHKSKYLDVEYQGVIHVANYSSL